MNCDKKEGVGDSRQSRAGFFYDGFALVGNQYKASCSGENVKKSEYAHENLVNFCHWQREMQVNLNSV